MNRFKVIAEPHEGLKVLEKVALRDSRGFFERLYCQDSLASMINGKSLKQVNHSFTKDVGTIRGLHYQKSPFEEYKLVSCSRGRIFDVAVDLRRNSTTFLKYFTIELSVSNFRCILIPPGFAHGFQTLEKNCELIYFHTAEHSSAHEGSVNAFDPILSTKWPEKISNLSDRDKNHKFLNEKFEGLSINEM